jgi:hypothetical protein
MTSTTAYLLSLSVLSVTSLIWFIKLRIASKSVRLLTALILTTIQILFEVYLTFELSPVRLKHIPMIHFFLLTIVGISARNQIKEEFRKIQKLTRGINNYKDSADPFVILASYWYIPLFFASFAVGIYPALLGGPSTVDERAYHWPQILGIVQNNGFSTFDSSLPWTYSYPLGNAVVSSFLWPFVQTDLSFRSIQILFALIAILSIYILGRLFSKNVGILSALIMTASPIFCVLIRMSSDDLPYGAFVLATSALLVTYKTSKDKAQSSSLLYSALISFALAGQFKYPIVSFLIAFPLIISIIWEHKNSRSQQIKIATLSMSSALLSFVYPIHNYIQYRNPFYPMTIEIGNLNIYKGPLPSIDNKSINPSTTFEIQEPFRVIKMWHGSFFDFFQTPNEDSLGAYNYVIGTILIAAFIYGLGSLKAMNLTLRLLLVTNLIIVILIPGIFLPRYGFYVIAILSIFAVNAVIRIIGNSKSMITFGLLVSLGLIPSIYQNMTTKKWIYSQSGEQNVFQNGQSAIDRKFDLAIDGSILSASAVNWIQQNVGQGEKVCYSAATNYPSSFWNLSRTSKVKYSPILETDRYPNSNNSDKKYSSIEVNAWVNDNLDCDYLIAYRINKDLLLAHKEFKQANFVSTDAVLIWEKSK